VAQAVEADEAFGPGGVAVLGAGGEVADATGAAEAVEQTRRLGKGQLADSEAEDVVVEEGQGGVGFFQAIQRRLFGVGDVFEEAAHGAQVEVAGMAFVVEEDEAAGPVGVALGGAVLAQARVGDLTNDLKQARRLGRSREGWSWRVIPGS
jgi:hypothetical protein